MPLLTRRDVANLLRVTEKTVSNMTRDGRLTPVCRIGRRPRFSRESLAALLRADIALLMETT